MHKRPVASKFSSDYAPDIAEIRLICKKYRQNMDLFYNLLEYPLFKEIARIIYIIILCAVFLCVPIIGCYFFGKKLRKKYQVPNWYFWTAYIFVIPVIVAPLVLFLSCFIDNPKNTDNALWAFLLFNTYAFWLIGGYFLSIKLYHKYPYFFSLLPSFISWFCAAGALWLGFFIVS